MTDLRSALARPLSTRPRRRASLVLVLVVVAVSITVSHRPAQVDVGVGLALSRSGEDWMRTGPGVCTGTNGAESVRNGALVEFINDDGEVRGTMTISDLQLGGSGDVCVAPQKLVVLSQLDDVVGVRIASAGTGWITRAQVEEAVAPDVYRGLSISLAVCQDRCGISFTP